MQNRGESDCICRAKIGSDAAPILFGRVRFHIALRYNFTRRVPERAAEQRGAVWGTRFCARLPDRKLNIPLSFWARCLPNSS
jgi:hypothetical protein